MPAIIVFISCTASESDKIAQALVEERLAACVSIVGPIKSIYRYEGKVCNESEQLLVAKTDEGHWEVLRNRVKELHSYAVPEIVYFALEGGDRPYIDWLNAALA
jgi:periplasmic divalent cation tolerance protein